MAPALSLIANGVGDTRLTAVIGDLRHKIDVYTHILTADLAKANCYITVDARAEYLLTHRPDEVPDLDPQGNPPSNRQLSHIFCGLYYTDIEFVQEYQVWLACAHHVGGHPVSRD